MEGNPEQDAESIEMLRQIGSRVSGYDFGIQTGDYVENGFALWADSYDDQSEADRAAHKAVPIQCALTLAGSLESVVITVNVRV